MAYQPPLIGYKQLLNFGAFSIPDTGGWIFIAVGVLLVSTWFLEFMKKRKMKSGVAGMALMIFPAIFLASCSTEPQQINYGKDACAFCKMNIVDPRFSAQCMSNKGKSFKFDDIHCLSSFLKMEAFGGMSFLVFIFLILQEKAYGSNQILHFCFPVILLRSPMGGNMAAFISEQDRDEAMKEYNGQKIVWEDINPFNKK